MTSLLDEHEVRVPYEQEIRKLTTEITRLTEVVEVFAEEGNWDGCSFDTDWKLSDRGDPWVVAQKALEQEARKDSSDA